MRRRRQVIFSGLTGGRCPAGFFEKFIGGWPMFTRSKREGETYEALFFLSVAHYG
jgi:hypothetical protein